MKAEKRRCAVSNETFTIQSEDWEFYKKYGVGAPTLSPLERQRRRMAFRNDQNLYHRKCDATGKQIISLYPKESKFTVYNNDLYWSDRWDPKDYGREFDFSRPFFEQFAELQAVVPRMAINGIGNENCEYTSFAGWDRNCYLIFTADRNEDCYFGYYGWENKNCVDFLFLIRSELCYQCIDCTDCYTCRYSQELTNCSDCLFCRDLVGCSNCFGSVGLRNKSYCFFNEQLSKEEYQRKLRKFDLGSHKVVETIREKAREFAVSFPRRARLLISSENVQGDYIFSSKDCFQCFDMRNAHDCRYCSYLISVKDCMDWDYCGDDSEMCYELASCANSLNYCIGCTNCWGGNSELYYCDFLTASSNCFGCIGMRAGKYCILNKEYSAIEYRKLKERIIDHMRETGEWGEFFPVSLSPHAYNETVAQDYHPLREEEALARGYAWKQSDELSGYAGPRYEIPDSIEDVDDSICRAILEGEGEPGYYKIIPQELAFYRKHGIPIPRSGPAQRHAERMSFRNPRVLHASECDNCQDAIETSYAPGSEEKVYCQQCYHEVVY